MTLRALPLLWRHRGPACHESPHRGRRAGVRSYQAISQSGGCDYLKLAANRHPDEFRPNTHGIAILPRASNLVGCSRRENRIDQSTPRQLRGASGLRRTLKTPPAVQKDAEHPPDAWERESGLRAGPVCGRPYAHVGWLPLSRDSCARRAFHTPCGASSHERRLHAASSS